MADKAAEAEQMMAYPEESPPPYSDAVTSQPMPPYPTAATPMMAPQPTAPQPAYNPYVQSPQPAPYYPNQSQPPYPNQAKYPPQPMYPPPAGGMHQQPGYAPGVPQGYAPVPQGVPVQQQPVSGTTVIVQQTRRDPRANAISAIVLSCVVFWCCNFPCGMIAFILAMVAQTKADSGKTESAISYKKASIAFSIIGIVSLVIIVIIAISINSNEY